MTKPIALTQQAVVALIALSDDAPRRARPRNHGLRLRKMEPIDPIYSHGDLYEIAVNGRICAHLSVDEPHFAIEKTEDITTTAPQLAAFLDAVAAAEIAQTDVSDTVLELREAFLREAQVTAKIRSDALFGAL